MASKVETSPLSRTTLNQNPQTHRVHTNHQQQLPSHCGDWNWETGATYFLGGAGSGLPPYWDLAVATSTALGMGFVLIEVCAIFCSFVPCSCNFAGLDVENLFDACERVKIVASLLRYWRIETYGTLRSTRRSTWTSRNELLFFCWTRFGECLSKRGESAYLSYRLGRIHSGVLKMNLWRTCSPSCSLAALEALAESSDEFYHVSRWLMQVE